VVSPSRVAHGGLSGHHLKQVNAPLVDPLRSQEAQATEGRDIDRSASIILDRTARYVPMFHLVLSFGITRRR
jgi:hypothetical protein